MFTFAALVCRHVGLVGQRGGEMFSASYAVLLMTVPARRCVKGELCAHLPFHPLLLKTSVTGEGEPQIRSWQMRLSLVTTYSVAFQCQSVYFFHGTGAVIFRLECCNLPRTINKDGPSSSGAKRVSAGMAQPPLKSSQSGAAIYY